MVDTSYNYKITGIFQVFLLFVFTVSHSFSADDNPGKREVTDIPSPTLSGAGAQRQAFQADEVGLDIVRLSRTFEIAGGINSVLEKLFTPPLAGSAPSASVAQTENTEAIIQQIAGIITGQSVPSSLLARVPDLIGSPSSDDPRLKSSEHSTLLQLLVRVGMQQRPQHFAPLADAEASVADTPFDIGANFLREFTREGALEGWLPHIRQIIEARTSDATQQGAVLEVVDSVAGILKWMGSEEVHNPEKSPLNKYVTPGAIARAIELEKWLKENRGAENYDEVQRQFMKLDEGIKAARKQAIKEGGAHLFSLLKHMAPELTDIEKPEDVVSHVQQESATRKRQEFETCVLKFGESDVFESNSLRSFLETVERQQCGKIWYQIVCESFQAQYRDSPLHQKSQQIWLVSHLDTIHHQPQEARSRMPVASIDGLPAPNFGYRTERSEAYQVWARNPLVKGSGDIIVDSFHWVVDFGCSLDEGVFLERLKTYLWGRKRDKKDQLLHQHEYDDFLIPFQLYLLEYVFKTPFAQGFGKIIPKELKKADSAENLIARASQALTDFKTVARNMFVLRPDGKPLTEEDKHRGLVFGVGFNGRLFDSPYHSEREDNEIWLTFSDSRRDNGGFVFLSFLKHVAEQRSHRLNSGLDLARNFDRYKFLIRQHLNHEIQNAYYVPDSDWSASMLNHTQRERDLLEGFMSQLEQDIPFYYLSPAFKKWIQDTSNWYSLPPKVTIRIAYDMPPEEHIVQYVARSLLFDALIGRPFSREHPELMSLLFLHWKEELLKQTEGNSEMVPAIQAADKIEAIPDGLRANVTPLLDQCITRVHPELEAIWRPVINKEFQTFMKPKMVPVGEELETMRHQIKAANKQLQSLAKSKVDVTTRIEEIRKRLAEAEQRKEQLEKERAELLLRNSANLSLEQYEQFKAAFFKDRDVAQCAEPVFCRVLGHDRFFSVFISKKTELTHVRTADTGLPLQLGNRIPQDVIAPCDKRCQHHALGHLYAGDMLGYQSADHLDHIRRTHGLAAVPDRFMTFPPT